MLMLRPMRGFAAALVLTTFLALAGCAAGTVRTTTNAGQSTPPLQQPASPLGLKHPEEVPVTARDEKLILALAEESLSYERESRFADVRAAPVTAAEARRATLGGVERRFRIVPSELAAEASLFDATRVSEVPSLFVPVLLGDRRLAQFDFEKVDGRWEPGSVGCEAPHHDRALVEVGRVFPQVLGGTPDETRWTDVDGSLWVIAKRGNREVAGFIDMYAYGSFGDPSVKLPSPGTVLTDAQFRALCAKMRTQN